MLIYCKQCGYSQELEFDEMELYAAWAENKRLASPFPCPRCSELLMNEEDWEVS